MTYLIIPAAIILAMNVGVVLALIIRSEMRAQQFHPPDHRRRWPRSPVDSG